LNHHFWKIRELVANWSRTTNFEASKTLSYILTTSHLGGLPPFSPIILPISIFQHDSHEKDGDNGILYLNIQREMHAWPYLVCAFGTLAFRPLSGRARISWLCILCQQKPRKLLEETDEEEGYFVKCELLCR
jgi:hypothetical protein